MTDRDVLIGIMTAVLALGEKTTGQKMTVSVPTEDGGRAHVVLFGGEVQWTTATEAGSPPLAAVQECG